MEKSKGLVELIRALTGFSENQALCELYDLANEPLSKVLDPNYGNHWAQKKTQFPNTPLILNIKAKFKTLSNRKKEGTIYITFDIFRGKRTYISDEDIQTIQVEDNLLKPSLESK